MPADPVALVAPLTGVIVPIEEVPDPVFAQKMVGDGFSIYPMTQVLRSPVDGEVIHIHAARHAVTVRSTEGLEILMHVGLDTVQMAGMRFEVETAVGAPVSVGDELLTFDLAAVTEHAQSILTQVVVTNGEAIEWIRPGNGFVAAGQDVAAQVQLVDASASDPAASGIGRSATSDAIVVPNPSGLHARPAATLANLAKRFASDVQLRRGDQSANAKSIMAIMGLSVVHLDKLQVFATGPDADEAVAAIAAAMQDGLGEDCPQLPPGGPDTSPGMAVVEVPEAQEPTTPRSADPDLLLGVSASPGLGVGHVRQIRPHVIDVTERAADHHLERRKLNEAVDRATLQLAALCKQLEAEPDKAAIFVAHQEILVDPDLLDLAVDAIDRGKSAPFAWRGAYSAYADKLAALQNELLAARANDVRDVGQRVLEELTGQRRERREMEPGTILVAEDLTPSDTAQLDRSKVAGFATTAGGASSHVAIIARSLDIPAVAGIEGRALDIPDGTRVILDGGKGSLQLNATDEQVEAMLQRQRRIEEKRSADLERAFDDAVTTDGRHVDVVANIGSVADAQEAMTVGAAGVGLLRSEFAFLGRNSAPSEDEQAQLYADIARALAPGQPLVIRTLDVGGDKPLPYLPIPREENPFLGIRGVRVGLDRPQVLRTQCRAILTAADAGAKLHVMFPMIATLKDFRDAKAIFDEEAAALGVAGVPLGIMVEVPSVAVMARQFAREADFFSVGTNDLTSYTLAMDRGHPKLASQVDPCNPAVLRLIGQAAEAAAAQGKWLGICGGIASDAQAVPILIGLGATELSCSIPAIPSVKAAVRASSFEQCRELAARALAADTAADVRALIPADEA